VVDTTGTRFRFGEPSDIVAQAGIQSLPPSRHSRAGGNPVATPFSSFPRTRESSLHVTILKQSRAGNDGLLDSGLRGKDGG